MRRKQENERASAAHQATTRLRRRRLAWKWALPGLLLLIVYFVLANDLLRFSRSILLYSEHILPSLRLEWALRWRVEPALERHDPDAALRALADIDADARLFEQRVAPYRIRAWLAKDDIARALSDYDRYLPVAEAGTLPDYAVDILDNARKRAPEQEATSIRFTDVTVPWNAAFEHVQRDTDHLVALYQAMGSGVGLLDLDADGHLDLLWLGGMESSPEGSANRVLKNEGKGIFADVTSTSGLAYTGLSYGVAAADLDGDALPELYITSLGRNHLFLNRGNMRFEDITDRAGVAAEGGVSTAAAFADIDRDGDLDLYVAKWVLQPHPSDRVLQVLLGDRNRLGLFAPHMYEAAPDQLFRNEGNLTFKDITSAAGIVDTDGRGLGVALVDFNGDLLPDIFVANDESPNRFYLNQGNATFRDASAATRMYDARAAMGVQVFDADSDGKLDLFYTNFRTEYNALALNRLERGFFTDQAAELGVSRSLGSTSWGVAPADFDADGDTDIAVVNGHPTPFDPKATPFRGRLTEEPHCLAELPLLYERRGEQFLDVTSETGAFGAYRAVGRGLVSGDIDGDGATDLVESVNNGAARVFRNVSARRNRWLIVRARWLPANRLAIGAKVIVETDDKVQTAVIRSGTSYLSQEPFEKYFGLGQHGRARVHVVWPDGTESILNETPADRIVQVDVTQMLHP